MQPSTKTMEKLLSVLSPEQLEQFVDALARAQGRAVDRRCVQSAAISFSEKGFVRFIHCSDDVFSSAPGVKMYKAE